MLAFKDVIRKCIPEYWRPIGHLVHLTRDRTRLRVAQGPFAGMRYGQNSAGSAYIPKLLGTYEREIAKCVEAACAVHPDLIVDIGAAEGYYACGLALRLPGTEVVAFEEQEKSRKELEGMIGLNHLTGRIQARGRCEPGMLEECLREGNTPLVVCDCEGYESTLLNLDTVPSLQRSSILVELHEFVERGIGSVIKERFRISHTIEEVMEEARSEADFPYADFYTRLMPRSYLQWAATEWRPERMSWLWMVPK